MQINKTKKNNQTIFNNSKSNRIFKSMILTLFLSFILLVSGCTNQTITSEELKEIEVKLNEAESKSSEYETKYKETKSKLDSINKELESTKSDLKNKTKELEDLKKDLEPYLLLAEEEALAKKIELEEERKIKEAEEEARAEAEKLEKEAERLAAEEAKKAEEARGYETGITYDQLARTPDDFQYEKVKFYGKVIQVIEGDSTNNYRLAVDDNYDNIILLEASKTLTKNNRVLEGDYVTIHGVSYGLYTYESTMGGHITVPIVVVDEFIQ